MSVLIKYTTTLLILLAISGCSYTPRNVDGPPIQSNDALLNTADAVPKVEPIRAANQKSYTVFGQRYHPLPTSIGYQQQGVASWYGKKFHGNLTAMGEVYDMYQMTAAHKTLPLPTYVRVRHIENGREIIVRVNDRGPFHDNRVIDLSYAAATKLGIVKTGTAPVEVTAINPGSDISPIPTSHKSDKVMTKESQTFLQVGTYSSVTEAARLVEQLSAQLGETVFLLPFMASDKVLYRVRVGPLKDKQYGHHLAERLTQFGFTKSYIVSE